MKTILLLVIVALSLTVVSCRNNNRGEEVMPTNMTTKDAQALAELEKSGSDLSKPHLFDFYLYFPNRDDAEEVAKILTNDGYQVTVRLGADNINWLCLASKTIIPSRQTLASISAYLEKLVKPKRGDYDGWETAIVR